MGWPPLQGRARGRGSGARDRVALRRAAAGRDPLCRRLARRHRRCGRRVGRDPARPDARRGQRACSRPARRRSPTHRPTTASRRIWRPSSAMGSARFEPLLAGRAVGMLSIEPAAAGASPELHTLLPLVAAAVSRRIRRDRERPPAHRGRVPARAHGGRARRRLPGRDARRRCASAWRRMVGARRATVLLVEDGRMQPAASRYADGSRDLSEWELMRSAPSVLPAAEAALHSGEPVVTGTSESPLVAGWWADTFGIESLIAVAIGSPPRAVGVLLVDDPSRTASPPRTCGSWPPRRHTSRPTIEQARMSAERTLAPARRHRDPPAAPGGAARGVGRGGRRGARAGDPGGDRGRAGDAADARRARPHRAREDRRRRTATSSARCARTSRACPRTTSACGGSPPASAKPIFVENAARQPPPARRSWWRHWG